MTKKTLGAAAVNVAAFPFLALSKPFTMTGKGLMKLSGCLEKKASKMKIVAYGADDHFTIACVGTPIIKVVSESEGDAIKRLLGDSLNYIAIVPHDKAGKSIIMWDKISIAKKLEGGLEILADNDNPIENLRNIIGNMRKAMGEEYDSVMNSRLGSKRL